MYLNEIIYRLCKEEQQGLLLQHRQAIQWIARFSDDQVAIVLPALIVFYNKFTKTPASISALADYVLINPDRKQDFIQRDSVYRELFDELKEYTPETLPEASGMDWNVLLHTELQESRGHFFSNVFKVAATWAVHGMDEETTAKYGVGIPGIYRFLHEKRASDFQTEPEEEVKGVWQDNTAAISQQLDYYLNHADERVLTGFPAIDEHWVLRKGKTMIVAGSSGDGKTTLLNSMVLNMARAGENILYISLKFKPKEVWETLAFAYLRFFEKNKGVRGYLHSLNEWQKHCKEKPTITDKDRDRMEEVIQAIQQREDVPGLIDVQRLWTADEIYDYFAANNPKHKYTVVVIDYLGRLEVSGSFRTENDRKAAREESIRQAMRWCAKQGSFLMISPSQVNREAHKSAKKDMAKVKDDDKAVGYDLDSLFGSSVLQQDVDLAMSVFSPDECKVDNVIKVKCLKWRGTDRFEPHDLKLDPRTKYVYDGVYEHRKQTDEVLESIEKEFKKEFPPVVTDIMIEEA